MLRALLLDRACKDVRAGRHIKLLTLDSKGAVGKEERGANVSAGPKMAV